MHFNADWLQSLCTNIEDNHHIKVKNLNEILEYIRNYYAKVCVISTSCIWNSFLLF